MRQLSIIGHLGADCEVHVENGREFVTFRVATTERFTRSNGQAVEDTSWTSCIMNGNGGKLVQYLRRGQRVFVTGDESLRAYSSAKTRQWEAGASINVRYVELIGRSKKSFKLELTGVDVAVNESVWYSTSLDLAGQRVVDEDGVVHVVNEQGFITPAPVESEEAAELP